MGISGSFHIGVYTIDLDESIEFYSNILGFKKTWHGMVDHPTGLIEAAVMVLGDCTIELVKPVDLNRVNNMAGPIQHVALKVDNLTTVMDSLRQKGVSFGNEGFESLPTFLNGINHTFLYGPSGERIELAEPFSE